jgi:hypothetical protein
MSHATRPIRVSLMTTTSGMPTRPDRLATEFERHRGHLRSPRRDVTGAMRQDDEVIARGLLMLSSAAFVVTGLAYLAVPGFALGIVGIEPSPTSEFLLRTEGVPLLFGAALLWAVRDGGHRLERIALLALAGYYVGGSAIDLAAYGDGIVGPASIPSAVVRIAVGVICVAATWAAGRSSPGTDAA